MSHSRGDDYDVEEQYRPSVSVQDRIKQLKENAGANGTAQNSADNNVVCDCLHCSSV